MAGSWTRAGNKHNKPEISCSVKNKEILRTPVSSPKHTLENHWKFVTKTMTSTFWKYYWLKYQFSSVIQSCLTLCDPIGCSMPGFPVHHQLPEFTQAHAHWVSDAIQPSHSLSPSSPPAFNLSQQWPKYWSFSFSITPSNEYSGLISFRMDWLDLLAVQGILKSLLQHHSSKASILQHSAFFIIQSSHPYTTTGKTIALTRWAFVGKAMSLLFNMLSRLVITFLPRSKCLLISWLQSPSSVILEAPQNKVSHRFHCFPIYLPWSDGARYLDLSFFNVEF